MGTAVYISETCRLYVAVLFSTAAASKMFALRQFERTIADSLNIRAGLIRYFSLAVIVAELFVAVLSVWPGAEARVGIILALLMALGFTGFVAMMLGQGKSVRCNCFGHSDDKLSSLDLLRNGILITACVFCLLNAEEAPMLASTSYLLLLTTAVSAFLLSVNLKEIVELLRAE